MERRGVSDVLLGGLVGVPTEDRVGVPLEDLGLTRELGVEGVVIC